jgi:hypothetical protein
MSPLPGLAQDPNQDWEVLTGKEQAALSLEGLHSGLSFAFCFLQLSVQSLKHQSHFSILNPCHLDGKFTMHCPGF